jgi:hypothetical protein
MFPNTNTHSVVTCSAKLWLRDKFQTAFRLPSSALTTQLGVVIGSWTQLVICFYKQVISLPVAICPSDNYFLLTYSQTTCLQTYHKIGAGRGIRTLKALMLTVPYSELLFGVACIRPRIFAFASEWSISSATPCETPHKLVYISRIRTYTHHLNIPYTYGLHILGHWPLPSMSYLVF